MSNTTAAAVWTAMFALCAVWIIVAQKGIFVQFGSRLDDEEMQEDPTFVAAHEDGTQRNALITALREARFAAGLTQREVARLMGTKQSAVSEMERQVTHAHLSTLQRYARAVGVRLKIDIEEAWRPPAGSGLETGCEKT